MFFILITISLCSHVYADIPIAICTPNFGATYRSAWQLNGNSNFKTDTLQLNPEVAWSSGTAFYTDKVCNSTEFKFSAFFCFRLVNTTLGPADGACFIVQQYSNQFGSEGEGIGYEGLPGKSIAVEFDTYPNSNRSDPDNNHVAVDFNGSVDHSVNANTTGLTTLVASSSKLSAIGISSLADSKMKYAWVDYDGRKLEVRLSNTLTRPAIPLISVNIDLANYFTNSEVFYGFSAATGVRDEENLIYSAYINNRYTPIDILNNTYTQGTGSMSVTKADICKAGSFLFNGKYYYAEGEYDVHLTNTAGCDSIARLQLSVKESKTKSISASICDGESYLFDGKKLTTTVTDTATYQLVTGCDSVVILNLTVHPKYSLSQNIYLAKDESYTINNNIYTKEGTYTDALKTSNGCDSTVVTTIRLVDIPNTFTPNNDGINDVFMKNQHVKIYNRNGVLMYEGPDGWDGKHKGNDAEKDTYFYVLYLINSKPRTGYITLTR